MKRPSRGANARLTPQVIRSTRTFSTANRCRTPIRVKGNVCRFCDFFCSAADAGLAGVGRFGYVEKTIRPKSSCCGDRRSGLRSGEEAEGSKGANFRSTVRVRVRRATQLRPVE